MNKIVRYFFYSIFFLVLTNVLIGCDDEKITIDENSLDKPYIASASQTSVTIAWISHSEKRGVLEYGMTKNYGKKAEVSSVVDSDFQKKKGAWFNEDVNLVKVMKVRLSGLKHGKKYFYKISGPELNTYENYFHTAPQNSNVPVLFFFGGDRSMPSDDEIEWVEKKTGNKVDFFLDLGDQAIARRFRQEWQGRIPVFVAKGNHDNEVRRYTLDNQHLQHFYEFPNNSLDYSVNWGPVFVLIHGTVKRWRHTYSNAQLKWIKDQLKEANNKWKFYAMHYPFFSDSKNGTTKGWRWGKFGEWEEGYWRKQMVWPIFEKQNVKIVFSGHDHIYQRSFPIDKDGNLNDKGTMNIVYGGGEKEYAFKRKSSWSAKQYVGNYKKNRSFAFALIKDDICTIEFWVSINKNKKLIDTVKVTL